MRAENEARSFIPLAGPTEKMSGQCDPAVRHHLNKGPPFQGEANGSNSAPKLGRDLISIIPRLTADPYGRVHENLALPCILSKGTSELATIALDYREGTHNRGFSRVSFVN